MKHIFTVGACGIKLRSGPPAALPGQACDGMLGTMVRIAPTQDCEARSFVDSSIRFEKESTRNYPNSGFPGSCTYISTFRGRVFCLGRPMGMPKGAAASIPGSIGAHGSSWRDSSCVSL